MIWDKIAFLRALFPARGAAAEIGRRWFRAHRDTPELAADLIRLGGVLVAQPMAEGEVAPLDPSRLAYEAGRRDLALQLLSMMTLTIPELNSLMENNDVERPDDPYLSGPSRPRAR